MIESAPHGGVPGMLAHAYEIAVNRMEPARVSAIRGTVGLQGTSNRRPGVAKGSTLASKIV